MPELFPWFLLLHVLGAIGAFGPTFAFPLIGAMGGREAEHANFASRVSLRISDRMVWPLALSMAVTGFLMIWSRQIDVLGTPWLVASITLYVVALAFSFLVQRPAVNRVIELTTRAPSPAASEPGAAPAGPRPGPPPELRAAAAATRQNGAILLVLTVAIVTLMVVRPLA